MPVPRPRPRAQRTNLSTVCRDGIRTAIFDGTLGPGDRLILTDLTSWLGASQLPVSLALTELTVRGLLDGAPYLQVINPTTADGDDAITALRMIAGALTSSEEELRRLHNLIARARGTAGPDAIATLRSALEAAAEETTSSAFAELCLAGLDALLYKARFATPTRH